MTFAALLLMMLGLTIGMPQRLVLRDEMGQTGLSELAALVRVVVLVAVIAEAIGTAALMVVFVPEFGWSHGFWQALFHAISAFNNAGFSLFSDSLTGYVADPVVNVTITALFILSGLGFVVLADINRQRRWSKLTLHSKLMLSGTLFLILFAWIMFALLEWRNPDTLGALDTTGARIWASWFQAVTPRTAGFNTLDYAQMNDSTTIMTMALMLVGGGPSSTAGGIKVTTLIVLALATLAFFRRQERLHVFGRSLGMAEVMKVLALTALSIFLVLMGLFLMSLTFKGSFIDLVFEVCSAFGTVGLSRGATGELDEFGRLVIIAIMFVGRLGPLTLAFFLATPTPPRVRYPEGKVFLG
jgi:trk system potassium uptake protein TrkH